MEAVSLCWLLNKAHFFSLTQHKFILIQLFTFTLCCMFRPILRPSSGMSIQKPYKGEYRIFCLCFWNNILDHFASVEGPRLRTAFCPPLVYIPICSPVIAVELWTFRFHKFLRNPTTGLTLLWACNPFRGNFNYWQVSRKEAWQTFEETSGYVRRNGSTSGPTPWQIYDDDDDDDVKFLSSHPEAFCFS